METRIPLIFISSAALCHVAGIAMGIHMGSSGDFSLSPVHAHTNLLGWVSLAIYGLAWSRWPDIGGPRTALAHLVLSVSAAIGFPIALWLELTGQSHVPILIATLAWAASAIMFLMLIVRRALKR